MRTWRTVVVAGVVAALMIVSAVAARMQQSDVKKTEQADVKKGTSMSKRASGTFNVKMTPKDQGADATIGGMTIDKEFHGDLVGTSKGQMLMASSSSVKDSAGYVAIEKVTGILNGRRGTIWSFASSKVCVPQRSTRSTKAFANTLCLLRFFVAVNTTSGARPSFGSMRNSCPLSIRTTTSSYLGKPGPDHAN
jgi:hypothetical protein